MPAPHMDSNISANPFCRLLEALGLLLYIFVTSFITVYKRRGLHSNQAIVLLSKYVLHLLVFN